MLTSYLAAWRQSSLFFVVPLLALLLAADALFVTSPLLSTLLATLYWGMLVIRLRFDTASAAILTLGMPLYWWWYTHTDYTKNVQDLFGHVDYIKYVARHWSLPRPDKGWSSYHPPLYYVIAALFYQCALWINVESPFECVRLLSVYTFLMFLFYAAQTIKLAALPRRTALLCLALVVFWPPGIMLASRMESDVLLYALCMAAFYHLARWHKSLDATSLQCSLLWLALAIITRSNAIVMAATISGVIAYNLAKRRISLQALRQRRFMLCSLCVVLALSVNVGRAAYVDLVDHAHAPFMVGNGEILAKSAAFKVTRAPENFLTFDIEKYLWPPFANPRGDNSGRQNFWAMLFKTSLWGEFHFDARECAHFADVLLLVLAAYTLLPIRFYTRHDMAERLPYLLLAFLSVAGLLANRYHVSIMPSGDVRYVYFFIAPMAVLFGYSLDMLEKKRLFLLLWLGMIVAGMLLVSADAVYLMEV